MRAVGLLLVLGLISLGGWLITIHFLAERYLRQAQRALERQRYAQAWEDLNRAKTFRPRSFEIHLQLARVARQLGKFEEADEHLRRCLDLHGGYPTEADQLERLLLRAQTGEVEVVFPYLWPYVEEKRPEAAAVLEALCYGFVGEQLMAMAERCIRRWRQIDPDNIQALVCEGWFWDQSGGPTPEAQENYARALELDPKRDDIRLRLGIAYLRAQNERKAIACFKEVLRQDPHNEGAQLGLATATRDIGKWKEARAMLTRFLEEHPNSAEALRELAQVAMEENNYPEAEKLLRQVLEKEPYDYRALYGLHVCVRQSGRKVEGRELSVRLERVRRLERSLDNLIRGKLRAQPKDPEVRYQVGLLYEQLGVEASASQWFLRTLQVDGDHQGALKSMVRHHEKKGEKEKADEYRSRIRER